MTLADQMRDDVSDVFLNTDEHAEAIVSQAAGQSPKTIKAIVNRETGNLFASVSNGQADQRQAMLYISTDSETGVESIIDGHCFKFDGLTWRVSSIQGNDGFGMQSVIVYHDVQTELSREGFWRQR